MSPHKTPSLIFVAAVVLLSISAIGASFAMIRLYRSEGWVRHTYEVEVGLGDIESSLAQVGRNRVSYLNSGTQKALDDFNASVMQAPVALTRIEELTSDNPTQQLLCKRLESNAKRRVELSQESVDLKLQSQSTPGSQMQLTFEIAGAAIETSGIIQEMRANEDNALAYRSRGSATSFELTVSIILLFFVSSGVMFWLYYRLLNHELIEREAAESSLRHLSVKLMNVQDQEARKFARELHDGLGQGLVVAKMTAEALRRNEPTNEGLSELVALLDNSLSETRTISYLLHPPMLDEIGFAAAAKWFIEGYSRRTEIVVLAMIATEVAHLPRHLELSLFRILQETLTNIHKHSRSSKAEVSVSVNSESVVFVAKDFGRGIPSEILEKFKKNGTSVGVGLAGMKERVSELKGNMEINSNQAGTTISITIPLGTDFEFAPPNVATSLKASAVATTE